MRITATFNDRSNRRPLINSEAHDSMMCGSSSLPTFTPTLTGLCAPMSCDDEEREIISGVKNVSHFFDLPKKLPEPTSNLSPVSVGATTETVEKGLLLQRIPTEEVHVHPDS